MKTITMMDLRSQPGEYAHLVSRHGESFIVTSQGKPVFKIVPVGDEILTVRSDGTTSDGRKPITFREKLGGEYAV